MPKLQKGRAWRSVVNSVANSLAKYKLHFTAPFPHKILQTKIHVFCLGDRYVWQSAVGPRWLYDVQ